jgi:hypothetical protein
MPLENWIQHCKVAQFLYDWQTLIAGILAVLAAVGTIRATISSANREIEASQAQTAVAQKQIETTVRLERERVSSEVDALRKSLAVEIRQYIDILFKTREILRRRSGPEKPMRARDLRCVVAFHPPTVYPASADRIGLLGPLAVSVTSFYSTIERLNFTVRFLTNDPEELVSRENIEEVASLLEQACRTSLPLLSELPLDERDAEIRAAISKWDADRPPERAP